jgi:acyl-CoA synthetase (AMP-forming)/AMP-acid ligase II
MNTEIRTGSDDRILLVMPLFHIGAMFMGLGAHFRGGTALLHRQFDPAAALDAIAAERATVLHLAPTMLQALLDAAASRPDALARIETVVYSAAPITGPTLAAAMRSMPGAGLLNLYGQTEVVSTGLPRELHVAGGDERSQRRLRSVGMPFPGNEVRITREDGTQSQPGEAGEVCVRSVAMFRGYWNDSQATAEVLRDGWCHTGDIGLLDADGLLHLVDRKKDVIISGGENIYSLEVEECLLAHPAVGQAAVIGVPDGTWGEAVSAVVVPADGELIVAADLREHVRSRLARYKARERIAFYASTPAYRPVLELHGWGDLQTTLNGLAKQGEWQAMGDLIDDGILSEFAVIAPLDELPERYAHWLSGLADRTSFIPPDGMDASATWEFLTAVRAQLAVAA